MAFDVIYYLLIIFFRNFCLTPSVTKYGHKLLINKKYLKIIFFTRQKLKKEKNKRNQSSAGLALVAGL